nr:hypothetical protein [Acidobacteriota bacterium]
LMTGAGVTTVNGPFNLSGLVAINGNRTLNNASTANWSSANGLGMRTGSGSVINNTGTWDAQTDGAAIVNYYGGATTFNNSGTFKKSAGTGTTSISILFTSTGTVDVQSGTLSLGANGSSDVQSGTLSLGANGSSTAALTVSGASATLLFAAGVFDLNAGTTVSGPGSVLLNSSGTLNVSTAVSIPAATTLTFLAGTLGGTGTLTTNGTFNWSGGLMTGAGVTTVNGPFHLSGLVAINGSRTLNNASTANWSSANGLGMRTGSGSVINNTGTWDAQTDGAAIVNYYGGATTFNNSGTFKKSAGTGTTSITILFTNTGAVDVQSGTLSLGANGSSTAALTVSGASATLLFAAGVFDLNAGTTISGPGTILLNSSGTLNVATAVSIPAATTFTFLAGTLAGTGTLTANGTFNWSGGLMTGAGVTTLNGPLHLSGLVNINAGRTLNNTSTATWTSANGLGMRTGSGSVINNTGTWDAQTDGAAIVNYYLGATSFNNSGTFKKSAGAGTTSISIAFTNTGTVDVQSGTLNVSGSSYKQTAGVTRLTGGALSSTSSIAIQGGVLAGSGTVTGPVTVSGTGVLSPGLSPGTLSLVGNYTQQGPAGAFNVEIGGTTPGSQYDRVDVSGAGSVATLAGVLNVSLVDSFVPAAGDSFTIMTYPSHTGTYTLNLPTLPCLGWKATYGATELVLTAFPLPTEVTGLAFPSTKVDLAWDAGVSGPTRTWDVLKGDLRQLPVGTGPNESCLAQATPGTTASDPATPAPNRGFWYVVRERVAGCGIGTYGNASSGAQRTSTACP